VKIESRGKNQEARNKSEIENGEALNEVNPNFEIKEYP
jgi:hypothetical protein